MFNFFRQPANHLSQSDAHKMLTEDPSIRVIDVRTVEEFREGHIANSINLPLDQLESLASRKLPKKDAKMFIICYSGSRSSAATRLLAAMGYSQVYDIGGIAMWRYGVVR